LVSQTGSDGGKPRLQTVYGVGNATDIHPHACEGAAHVLKMPRALKERTVIAPAQRRSWREIDPADSPLSKEAFMQFDIGH
jgi:hypothetical protein